MKPSHSSHKSDKTKPKSLIHDSEGRMGSPIAGNPAQRKNQVQSIANGVFSDGMEPAPADEDNPLEDGNYQPESAHGIAHGGPPVAAQHSHTVHDHGVGKSTTHNVPHGSDCPACGTEYMGHGSR